MTEETENTADADIKESDIVFDCRFCGKSLAIDFRGAGLSIPCTDCGKIVEVPIPEGLELSDIDSSEHDQESRIMNLRKSLSAAQFRIRQFELAVEKLNGKCSRLEKALSSVTFKFGSIHERVGSIADAQKEITLALEKISSIANDDLD